MFQKAQSFWALLLSPKNVGDRPLNLLASLFVVGLVFHIPFEVWGIVCEAIRASDSLLETISEIRKKITLMIGSNTMRNLVSSLVAILSFISARKSLIDR